MATAAHAEMRAPVAPGVPTRAHRALSAAATGLLVLSLAAAVVAGIGFAKGYRPLVERTGSMAPELQAGDLVLDRRIAAADARPGDVITFADPTRRGASVTHRVVSVRPHGNTLRFVTRGDANAAAERWTISAHGTVGRVSGHIRGAGRVAESLSEGLGRWLITVLALGTLGTLALRRIWRQR